MTPTTVGELRRLMVETGRVGPDAVFTEMVGGVSSLIAAVCDDATALVVKSPREQLAVQAHWQVSRRRGAFEAAALARFEGSLGPVRVPRLLFFDEERIVLGEELIEEPCPTYKSELLEGRAHPRMAGRLGEGLSLLHRLGGAEGIDGEEGRNLFEDLRLDPYYRETARRHPDLGPALVQLIDETNGVAAHGLVHGDFTPKNVLITASAPVLLDWEVVHCGDPAFDVGMMSAHLLLKSISHRPEPAAATILDALSAFWKAYRGPAEPGRSLRHTGGIMLARLYGKSPVEYLTAVAERQLADAIGRVALSESTTIEGLISMVSGSIGGGS